MYMQGLANFIDDFLGGVMLISYALVVGSVLWSLGILRIFSDDKASDAVILSSVKILKLGAISLAISMGLKLVIKGFVLAFTLGELPFEAYADTVQFKAGLIRFVIASAFIALSQQLNQKPADSKLWRRAAFLTLPLIISGAWLVHGVGRLENSELLMLTTVIHQFSAAVWFGCIAQLLSLWYLSLNQQDAKALWPIAITRFSILGGISVLLLLMTGLPLAVNYVASLKGLFGTGYGILVVTKIVLLMIALGFARLNWQAGKDWKTTGTSYTLFNKAPFFIEAETFILVGILFIAATLSSQPPAVDISNLTASISEVIQMFMPRIPRIISPSHEALLAGEAGRVAVIDKVPSIAATEWSDYNHNVTGILLSLMGLIAMLSYVSRFKWVQYWPLGFVCMGVFLFFRSDAETWPLGPIGFWESTFGNGEVFQHRIATLVALILGLMEMRARTSPKAKDLQFIFPMLCAFGGVLLLTHAHAEFELKSEFLIQTTHTAMGLLAVTMAAGRWLELRLPLTAAGTISSESKIAGFSAILAMFLIGMILMFYREPLF